MAIEEETIASPYSLSILWQTEKNHNPVCSEHYSSKHMNENSNKPPNTDEIEMNTKNFPQHCPHRCLSHSSVPTNHLYSIPNIWAQSDISVKNAFLLEEFNQKKNFRRGSPQRSSSSPTTHPHREITHDDSLHSHDINNSEYEGRLQNYTQNKDNIQINTSPVSLRLSHKSPSSRSTSRLAGILALISCLVCLTGSGQAMPFSKRSSGYEAREKIALRYLQRFGYLSGPSQETQNIMNRADMERAIKALQKAGGAPQTGMIDNRTLELMRRKRCGNMDDFMREESYTYGYHGDGISQTLSRHRRYTLAASRWPRTNLTFHFVNYTNHMRKDVTRALIKKAFQVWSNATTLSFTESHDNKADILIQFARRFHSDGYPFDGPGMVLAHAFFPGGGKGGDIHFDNDETWSMNSSAGIDLFMVAAHELGHSLGLGHSGDPSALMYPWYMGMEGHFTLPDDDLRGITDLYRDKLGKKKPDDKSGVKFNPDKDYRPVTPSNPDKGKDEPPTNPCDGSIDALTRFRSEIHIFVGKWFFRYNVNKRYEKPTEIHKFWHSFPKNLSRIDAVFERKDGKLVFFSGDRYWVFKVNFLEKMETPVEGRPITDFNIPADVKKIDAAFVWGYNKGTYLVSGDMYWKMNDNNTFVEYDYPRPMTTWKNVPTPLDAAFQDSAGDTIFFQGQDYWKFYDVKMRARKGFPRRMHHYFSHCPLPYEYNIDNNKYESGTEMLVEIETSSQHAVLDTHSGASTSTYTHTLLLIIFLTYFLERI